MNYKNQHIYKRLLEKILFFKIRPGEILNEKSLAEEFQVSRTPIREVLNRLEWEGLVRIIPRSGSIVTDIEFQKILHVFQIRLEHEAIIGRMAAEKVTEQQLAAIKKLEGDCAKLVANIDRTSLMRIDFQFRDLLYEAAGNPILGDISRQLYNLTVRLWFMRLDKTNWVDEVNKMTEEIEQTHAVLVEGDPEKTAKLRQYWLRENIERMKSQF